jgi:ABC-2 type transport system ATP-binding protein
MLALEDVRKSFGEKTAVDGITLEVPAGEVFGLLGPNGAGKSTTLRMVSGLVFPDSGRIMVDSVDMSAKPDAVRSRVAYVPDEPTVYPRLTGREFLRFAGRLRGIAPDELEQRIRFHERLFDMEGWLDKRAESYSHGMIQRVVVSSAFVARASLYAIDEPLVGLDPASAETFHRMARSAAAGGAAVVISTHTLPVAHRFCHRLGIIHRGRLVRTLRPEEVDAGDLQQLFFSITGTSPADVSQYFD